MSAERKMWELMEKSNAETMLLKFFRKEGDEYPFRAMFYVRGANAIADLEQWSEERASIPSGPDPKTEEIRPSHPSGSSEGEKVDG